MAGKKVFVVIPYYDRIEQLQKTLRSILLSAYHNFHIVVVDDASPRGIMSHTFDDEGRITIMRFGKKHWVSPDVAANTGIYFSLKYGADIIILQNPECYHHGDVITYAVENITDHNYISFACFSLDREESRNMDGAAAYLNNKGAGRDFETAWYNHPIYRPVGYEFCAAITRSNMVKLNGYDERFSSGWAYSDNYFLHRIYKMGLKVEIPDETKPFVYHQWHERKEYDKLMIEKNRKLFEYLKQKNTVKAIHIFTKNFDQ